MSEWVSEGVEGGGGRRRRERKEKRLRRRMVWRKGIRLVYSALLNKENDCTSCASLASMDKEAIASHPCHMPYAMGH